MEKAQNAENMEIVKKLMENAEQVRLGSEAQEGIRIDYMSLYGNKYEGTVVFKRPSMKDYMRMGALKSEYLRLNGVVNINLVDSSIKEMAQVMATLTVLLVKRPEWLMKLEEVEELDMLFHVFAKYEVWENSFRKPRETEPTGNSGVTE